jgi:hypothetical protein
MTTLSRWLFPAVLVLCPLAAPAADYQVKEADSAPPKELDKAMSGLLGGKSIQFQDGKGEVICELWLRQEVPSFATEQQAKNGLTYRELAESTVLGAVRVVGAVSDYRKQTIKPGVYTIRLGFQPDDGDHACTAPHKEFALMIPAEVDKKPDLLDNAKELQERSTKATGTSHPGVFLLFPGKDPGDAPKLASLPGGHWVVTWKQTVVVKEKKFTMNFALTLVGASKAG